jgi:hypothetical protein
MDKLSLMMIQGNAYWLMIAHYIYQHPDLLPRFRNRHVQGMQPYIISKINGDADRSSPFWWF